MIDADVEIDATHALKGLSKIEKQLPEAVDKGTVDTAMDAETRARRQLVRQGSVASGKGVDSLDVEKAGRDSWGVVGRSYLVPLDTGTQPHTVEVTNRLIIWAEKEGWAIHDIVDHIEERGTKPMPRTGSWREIAFEPAVDRWPEKIRKRAKRVIDI